VRVSPASVFFEDQQHASLGLKSVSTMRKGNRWYVLPWLLPPHDRLCGSIWFWRAFGQETTSQLQLLEERFPPVYSNVLWRNLSLLQKSRVIHCVLNRLSILLLFL
jgi:hypothetical protein